MDIRPLGNRAAVIGLGLSGVTSVKNLLEQGFDVTGFDQNDYVGGLWKWSSDVDQVTVLHSTRANVSKWRNSYTDFPFPEDVSNYPSAEQFAKYIDDYAEHFNIKPSCRFGVKILKIDRAKDDRQWEVRLIERDSREVVHSFDRVLITTGSFAKPWIPKIDGMEHFRGQTLHAQAFKDGEAFAGKRVLIVGFSNTGCDIAVDLAKAASTTYISHRAGVRIIKRNLEKPVELKITRRTANIGLAFRRFAPNLATKLVTLGFEYNMRRTFPGVDFRAWHFLPAPPFGQALPVANDYIVDDISAGRIKAVRGIRHIKTDGAIQLTDEMILSDIDVIIFSTGYGASYDILGPSADPTAFITTEWDKHPNMNGVRYPRLYRGHFSTIHPDSLAFIGPYTGHSFAACINADLSAQAIAQVWKGGFELPPKHEMDAWCDTNYRNQLQRLNAYRIPKVGFVDVAEQERWLNEAAGNGMNENLAWFSSQAWRLWWQKRKLVGLVMGGLDTPFVYRLFEGRKGGRKRWDAAEEEILKANAAVKKLGSVRAASSAEVVKAKMVEVAEVQTSGT